MPPALVTSLAKRRPGDRLAGKRHKFLTALLCEATTEDIAKIVRSMITQASKGNVQAAALVMDRLCGKVDQGVTLTGANGGPIQIDARVIFDAPGFVEQLKTLTETVPTIDTVGTEVVEGTEVRPHTPDEKQDGTPGI